MHLNFEESKKFRDQIPYKNWLRHSFAYDTQQNFCLAYWVLCWKAIFKKGKEKKYLSSEIQCFFVRFTGVLLNGNFFFLFFSFSQSILCRKWDVYGASNQRNNKKPMFSHVGFLAFFS